MHKRTEGTMRCREWLTLVLGMLLLVSALTVTGAVHAQDADDWDQLWALVPPSLEGTCEPLTFEKGDATVPSAAALVCYEGADPAIEDIGLFLFSGEEALLRWWDERTERIARETDTPLADGDCRNGIQGIEPTSVGQLICYRQSGNARVRWIDLSRLLYGSFDTDKYAIGWAYDWWQANVGSDGGSASAGPREPRLDAARLANAATLPERAFTSTWIGTGPDDHTTRLTANAVDGATGYRWDIDGDGASDLEGPTVEHTFDAPGERHVTLTAVRADGSERSRTMRIAVDPAITFAPLVYLHPDEIYWPMSAEAFIENSSLHFGHEACRATSPFDWQTVNPTRLGDGGYDGQLADDRDCRPYGDVYTSAQLTRPFNNVFPADEAGEGFYLDLDDDWYPGMRVGQAPAYYEYEPGAYLIYWFLSGYNEHELDLPGRTIGNTHEGDWEHIAIQLDDVDQATLFAYYQHDCDPVVFNRLEMGGGFGPDTELVDGTHPVVYSALGSHASYWQPIDQGVLGTVSGELRARLSQITGTDGEEMCWRKDTAAAGVPWRTWEHLADARGTDWYGYGGAWGVPGAEDPLFGRVNDGPLGPSGHLLARATPGWGVEPVDGAKVGPMVEWTRRFAGSGDAVVTYQDRVYVVATVSNPPAPGSAYGDFDVMVRGYRADGSLLWSRKFGTWAEDEGWGVAVDRAGDVYVSGVTHWSLSGQPDAGGGDAFIRKYSPDGRELWTWQFGTSDWDVAADIVVDDAFNVYVVGNTQGQLPGQTAPGWYDAFIRKYSPSGRILWTRQYATPNMDSAYAVALDSDQNPYVVGALDDSTRTDTSDAYLRKYSPAGATRWTRRFGATYVDEAYDVAVDSNDEIYIVGITNVTYSSEAGDGDAFVRKYGPDGSLHWARKFGTSKQDQAEGVAITTTNDAFVVGSLDAWGTNERAFERNYGPDGRLASSHTAKASGSDRAEGVAADASGAIYVVGSDFLRKYGAQ